MVFDWRIEWTRTSDKDTDIPVTDCISASINKSTEIKNNICQLTLKNSASSWADDGSTIIGDYVNSTDKTIKFGEEDRIKVWADFLTDASEVGTSWYDDNRLLGTFMLEEHQIQTVENQSRIQLKAVDVAYLLFNSIYTFSYGVSNVFTAPGIIRQCAKKFGESRDKSIGGDFGTAPDDGVEYLVNARFLSEGGYITDYRSDTSTKLDGALNNSDTTITVDSTAAFDGGSDGTIVIDTEHISYTGKTATTFTGCTRGIDDTVAAAHDDDTDVYQGFPQVLMSKIWKPLFEWIGEISQTGYTNFLSENIKGGTLNYNRAFLFWVDEQNKVHWVYPDDEPDLEIELSEEGRRSFRLDKSVFDAVNFIIYNAGQDMYGNGIIYYWYDKDADVDSLKMRYQPMSSIADDLVREDLFYFVSARATMCRSRWSPYH
jgi:hypothetical protein